MVSGGKRSGSGRPAGTEPQTIIKIAATESEKAEILGNTTPRERAEALLQLARSKPTTKGSTDDNDLPD